MLKGGERRLEGKTIEVWPADDEGQLALHKAYYLRHMSKSPIVDHYRPKQLVDGGPCIVFLVEQGKSFAFTVEGAMENLAQKAEIVALERERPPTIDR